MQTDQYSEPAPLRSATVGRRAALAGMLGTVVENYDFVVYAFVLVYTAPVFFPGGDPTTAILTSLLVFGVGFVARPLGGIVFGRIGDRRGRRFTLLFTVGLMGFATVLIGVIPGYASIGVWAPVLLVVARLAQGLSAGGEVIGAATYVIESSTPGRRGLFSSATPLGAVLGTALAPAVVGLCTVVLGAGTMAAWGWRVPFLIALPLTIGCLLFRLRIEESPEFADLVRHEDRAVAPVKEAIRGYWRQVILAGVLALVILFAGYTFNAYLPIYMTTVVVAIQPGAAAGGSQAPVVNSWVRTS